MHLDTTAQSEGPSSRNAGFIRQSEVLHGPLPDKSGVPVIPIAATVKQGAGGHSVTNRTPGPKEQVRWLQRWWQRISEWPGA